MQAPGQAESLQHATFVDLLKHRAQVQPQALAFRFLSYPGDGVTEETISYQALDARAQAVAQHLLRICKPGDRALMLYPSGIDFIVAYFGCLYAGVIAVPGYPPKRNQKLDRLKSLVHNCQAAVALTDSQTRTIAQPQFGEVAELQTLQWLSTDALGELAGPVVALPQAQPQAVAFLQYTSGSTGDPKGVMVTHHNLMENSRSMYVGGGHSPDTVIVGWLPLFHDMGLIGTMLQAVYAGAQCTLMAPASFLQRPMRWLEAISKYRATTSGGPNFAYDLCVSTIKDADLTQLDLRSWTLAFNGAEPIRGETVRAFSEKFAACGFSPSAHYASYGMAETTLMISASAPGKGMDMARFDEALLKENKAVRLDTDSTSTRELVSCGFAKCEQGYLIVDPVSLVRCKDGEVGEIWVHGSSNAAGYWQNPQATAATFAARTAQGEGPFLRTGDLGFAYQGALYVSGRLKDVVIIRGQNHYPQDIELTAFESHEAFVANGAAVFTVAHQHEEQLVVVLEVRRTFLRTLDPEALAMAIQAAVALQHELQVQSIVFIKPGQLPKTSSGKVQRQACKQQYLRGELEAVGRIDRAAVVDGTTLAGFDKERWSQEGAPAQIALLEAWLTSVFEAYAKLKAGTVKREVAYIGYGVDSLVLTQMAARISDELDCMLQIQDMFVCENIQALATFLNANMQDPAQRRQRIVPVAPAPHYPLSFAQQRMWFLMQYEASALYNIGGTLHLEGAVDVAALDRSFKELVRRHDALRTRFVEQGDDCVQRIMQDADWQLSVVDMSDRSAVEIKAEVDQELNFVFDLSQDMLFRATLYQRTATAYELVVCMHHIVADGWSIGVLMQEVSALYSAYAQHHASPLTTLPIQYADYAVWQRAMLQGAVLQRQQDYWKNQLQGVVPLTLATDKARPSRTTYAGHSIGVHLNAQLTEGLKALSRDQGVTLYMTLLASFGVLLHKYSGQDDICVGTPIANRTAIETRSLIGFFVNTLALRTNFAGDPVFTALLQQVKTTTVDAYAHQDLPFEKVVDLAAPERDTSTSPIFQVMLVLQEAQDITLSLPGIDVSKGNAPSRLSKFDITLELREGPDGLVGGIEYKTDLFDDLTMRRLSGHFKRVLAAVVAQPQARLSQLSLLNADERHELVELWNDTERNFRQSELLHGMFAAQVQRTPDAPALFADGQSLTFGQLDERANQLANALIAHGVQGNALVALCVDRSVAMVVGMLAALKAGAAYVPLDPSYPLERLTYMLEHSRASILITQPDLAQLFPGQGVRTVVVDPHTGATQEAYPTSAPQTAVTKADTAYVIYTSGSTGRPKGVMISHAAISNQMAWMLHQYPMQAADRMLQKTPYSFDASVWEIWAPLLSGAQLVLAPTDGHRDVHTIVNTVVQERITVIQLVPALLRAMLTLPEITKISTLRRMFLGGEALPVDLAKQALALAGRVINLYGPTECSINASYFDVANLDDAAQGYVPIGKPVSNLQFYVLDAQRTLVPAGVPGELYVAGVGLSHGYLNQPDLTQERFVDNPFNIHHIPTQTKLYRTGDLVRLRANGQLDFIARVDEQIKIRGFRIELGEIEAVVAKYPGLKDSAVAVKGGRGDERLVAYVVPSIEPFSIDGLRMELARQLPEYMVPSVFVTLPALPLNQSGKVDRKALPEPQKPNFSEYLALSTPTEFALAKIWAGVLEVDVSSDLVHAKSNFFHLGGHSLLAARMVAQIRAHWKIEFPIKSVFDAQELQALALLIDQAQAQDAAPAPQAIARVARVSRDAPLVLSHAQQRMWIVNALDEQSAQYNMPASIELRGALDVHALEQALAAFVHRHEILRTVYRQDAQVHEGNPYQLIQTGEDFALRTVDLSALGDAQRQSAVQEHAQQEARTPFDLAHDLMLRACLLRLAPNQHTLLVTLHHIASDGWSTTILVKELTHLYGAFASGAPALLPELPLQYADYAAWQRSTLSGDRLASLLSYWSSRLGYLPSVHHLPLDYARPALPSYQGATFTQTVEPATVLALRRLAQEQGATLFMVMHAALATLVHRYSAEEDIVIGTPVANRDRVELEPLVGLFVNTLVLRSDFSHPLTFAELLAQSSSSLRDAYDHQDLPFEMLVNALNVERSQSVHPLFQIMLVFQNGPSQDIHFPGLEAAHIQETTGTTKFDLTLNVVESGQGLQVAWEYALDLFSAATIQRLSNSFATLLDAIAQAPLTPVNRLPLIAQADRQQLLVHSNIQADDAFAPTCAHLLFEAQALKTPQAIALQFNGQSLSYQALNERANQVAHHLVATGVTPDTLVGLCVERSLDMVVALLGILKAGGAYVGFDPAYPTERLRYLLEDSAVQVVLTQSHLLDVLPLSGQHTICMDQTAWFDTLPTQNVPVERVGLTSDSLAYVIYTSGSTGNPKASLLMHKGLSNLAQAEVAYFHVQATSRVIQFASFAFDAATWEIFMALAAGATLHIVPKELAASGAELSTYVEQHLITHATLPPALLSVLDRHKWRSVAHLVVAGEHCPLGLVKEWAQERHFYNAYGPSETTVCASMGQLAAHANIVHMGKPMRGVQLYVLDALMQPTPVGVAGQLYVGGRGVGRGYLRRESLTQEKFVANPFGDGKLYATGDLARWLADGNVEFIGRIDNQIKIRGFRIELGEIETTLSNQPGVAACTVVEHNQRLVAYVVATHNTFSTDDLRQSLANVMPGYMIPSAFILLDSLPMTPNGKVDKKKLPTPDVNSLVKVDFVAPRDATEQRLAAIWCELLELDQVGIHHNFFDLGGHSLLAIRAISRIKETLGVQLKVTDLFVYTNIASLARHIAATLAAGPSAEAQLPLVAPRTMGNTMPLSLEQKAYWFLYELEGGTSTYNIPMALRLTGQLNVQALEQSFAALVQRHESLRTVLQVVHGEPSQQVLDAAPFTLLQTSKAANRYKEVLDQQIELDARYVFDLAKEIPIRAVLHKLYDNDFVLTILLHHTMADGWSIDILVRELARLYNAFNAGAPSPLQVLPALPVQYGDYAVWQQQHLVGEYYEQQIAYWREALKGLAPLLDLPTDYPRPSVQSYRGKESKFALPFQLTQALTAFSRKHKTTLFNTLLAGLNVLLSRYSRSEDIAVGTAIANRSQSHLEPLIGCFANTLVVRTRLEQSLSFVELVKRVNGVVFESYEHAGIPFDAVVDAVQPVRSLGVPPIFQVMFRLHNQKAGQGIGFDGMALESLGIASESAKLDLNFSLIETNDGLEGVIEYATDLFTADTVQRIAKHYQLLLESAMADASAAIGTLEMLSKEEFARIEKWNSNTIAYPDDECVYELFEQSAQRVPHKLAYVCGDARYTYAQLNARANQLAHFIQAQCATGAQVSVGLSVDRSAWAGVATLAIFKAGATFVPLDPKYPVERLEVMLDVVQPRLILTLSKFADRFAGHNTQLVFLDQLDSELETRPVENLQPVGSARSAYILFTSGTTGRPKAILVSHKSFRNMVVAHAWAKLHDANSRVLQFASLSFSISLWDSFMAWVAGGTLVSVNNDESLPGEPLYALLEREQITHATWPVSLLSTLPVERMPLSLQTIISSAEPCNDAVVKRWTQRGVRFLNMYGNSEVSLGSTLYEYHKVGQKLTIGVAFPNTRMYLLDKYLRQVPIGVIAEIHTAGAGLATCYWNNPEATAASFIPNPFAPNTTERLYKTGDLGRYLPDGEIEFIGREDFQVSIRGFRVELTEIENILRGYEGIADVAVVSQPDANQLARLVCFYVEKDGVAAIAVGDLRALVARKLPGYMVPSLFVRLDAMPLTPNRKVDRLGLPKPRVDDQQQGSHVAPRNALEEAVAKIWSEVLGLQDISVERNFFEVGGHSLLAVQVVARIKDSLALPISIKDLFVHASIESLAAFLSTLQCSGQTLLPTITAKPRPELIALSLDQKPYWFLHQLEGGSYTYNIPLAMRVHGALDVAALRQSFATVLARHESLRTIFPVHDGEPAQKVADAAQFELPLVNVTQVDVMPYVRADFLHIFDLENDLPIRARLLRISEQEHVVTVVLHHAVADGWSLNLLMEELTALYSSFSAGRDNPLAPLALQYGDYSQWQHENIVGDYYNGQIAFWKSKLSGMAPLLNLPLDYARPPVQSYRGSAHAIALPFALTAKLNQYARQHNTTLYNVLLSGLAILLSRYGRTDDVPVGTAVANRPQRELEPLIGCFANTLVIRCRVNPKENFQMLVGSVGGEALEAFSHATVPFDGVVEALQPERSLGVPPVFQVMFRLHNQQMAQTGSFANLRSELLDVASQSAKLDLNFSLVESADGLGGVIEYATDIFSEATIQRIAQHFQTTLSAAVHAPTLPIEKLSVLTPGEMEQVRQWNSLTIDYPQDECFHHLFERSAQRTPNKLAYVCGQDRFTYAELNARANRLAHFLQSKGISPDHRVGVCVERSTWAGISALAAFKSGGTYVPLDANYPKDRLSLMVDVAKPTIILALASTAHLFAGCDAEIVLLDTGWEAIQSQPVSNPAPLGAAHSAYILFTSGTTGKPKGILVSHHSFRNVAVAQQWAGLLSSDNRVLQFASLSFSIALWGTCMAWAAGGTLYSVAAAQALPDEPLYELLESAQITHVTWPVSMLTALPIERIPVCLRTVVSSAEPCNDAVVQKWTSFGCRFLNLYGNSEVAIGSTLYEYRNVGEKLTIGKALPNTQMYLLDENLQQVPIGVIAEIHTAGVGLATRYVGNPQATAKSFIPNPFSDAPGSRMYKTGDLGRYLPNGEIEFIGREDFQVSIRGFRVELTEIEDVLRAVPGVLEAVVVSRNDEQGLARLVCFYTAREDASAVHAGLLRNAVAQKLPNYMVPSMFVALDAMPLTPNRKIDRLALPQATLGDSTDDTFQAPASPTEKALAQIWSSILNVNDIGVHSNFFELGGHSLLATRIVARIRAEFKIDLSLQQFFESPTIAALAALIAKSKASYVDQPIKILSDRSKVPLSFAQQRMWFLDRYEENSNFYHMPSVMNIVGDLNAQALNDAFAQVIARHEALRTNFIASDGQAYQHIRPVENWSLACKPLAGGTRTEQEAAFADYLRQALQTPFDLSHDELIRVALFELNAQEYRLFVNMHHIVADGWSITVLINEVTSLYAALASGSAPSLKTLPVQYADYAAWQIEYLQGAVLAAQSSYWCDKLQDLSTLALPLDFERPKNQTYNGDRLAFEIEPGLLEQLNALSTQQGTTLFMTLLSAFNVLLQRYSGQNDICIGTPIANRVRTEIEPLIGFFANTLVLRSDLDANPCFTELLQQVKATTLGAYSHQDIPFEKVVDLVVPQRDPSRSPLFQVSFSLQSLPQSTFALEDVSFSNAPLENKTAKFDLLLEILQAEGALQAAFEYNTDLFLPQTIQGYVASFVQLLRAIVRAPQCRLSELALVARDHTLPQGTLALADYPLLQALYASYSAQSGGAPSSAALRYAVVDDAQHPVPMGVVGRLQLLDSDGTVDAVMSGRVNARQRKDSLELLGAVDGVALVDGVLVDPNALERHLLAKPGVRDCHVAVRMQAQHGNQIVVYVVGDEEQPQAEEYAEYLRNAGIAGLQILACVRVAHIPLTKHGEVNAQQLYKHAVVSAQSHARWLEQLRGKADLQQAVFVHASIEEQQTVSHVSDLLPAASTGIGGSQVPVVTKGKKAASTQSSMLPALVMGEVLQPVPGQPATLGEMLCKTAANFATKPITFYHADSAPEHLTYAQVLHQAQCVMHGLRSSGLEPGDKVIFQLDRNEDFVTAFWACQLGGFIPVPIAVAKNFKKSNPQTVKVAHAWNMLDRAVVLAGAQVFAGVQNIGPLESVADFATLDISVLGASPPAAQFHQGASDDVALIMLTSGSTGLPKGVQLSHANLIGRTMGSVQKNGFHSEMVGLNWMALDHVGGIIYFHIRDTYLGAEQIQVDTDYILADPLRWLQLIHAHRVNITWAPNFAFSLVVEKQAELKKLTLDLSCMQFMLNGAEAVVPKTTQAFIELMQAFHMPDDAVKPVFGMSEVSSGMTYSKRLQLTYGSDDTVFVSVGGPIPGDNLRIVDENDQLKMQGESGRLQISGVTVMRGYLGGESVNKDAFTADGWFKTGDLAFLDNGELTITGREKDIIIINGVNFYSHEIEAVVQEVPHVVVSFTGACAVRRSGSASDQLAIFFNTALKGQERQALIKSIRQAVMEKVGINPSYIVPLEKEQIPKTEIGKIQLSQLAKAFNGGAFDAVLKHLDIAEQNENTLPDWFFSKTWVQRNLVALPATAAPECTLVFADANGCADQLALGGTVVRVTEGQSYQENGEGFQLNPATQEHFEQMLATLAQRAIVPTQVVNLWDYDATSAVGDALAAGAELPHAPGLYSAWNLARALAQQDARPAMRWTWCSRNAQRVQAQEAGVPEKAATTVLLKTIAKEYPWISCQHVDLDGESLQLDADLLRQEVLVAHADADVAYRASKRFVLRLQREDLARAEMGAMPIVQGGGYLLSGGLGGIGYELSKLLLKQFGAKLLLLGRTPRAELSAVKLDMLDELAALGQVHYAGVDVCNPAELEAAVGEAENVWKQRLAGVFHLAGLSQEQVIADQTIDSLQEAIRVKTVGTRALHAICEQRSDTLFVNFSSASGFFGGAGMAAYSIANAYQTGFVDAVAHRNKVKSFSVGWSLWHDTGMGSQYKQVESLSCSLGFKPIPVGKGLSSLLAVLAHDKRNVFVGLDDTKANVKHWVPNSPAAAQQLVCYFCANQSDLAQQLAVDMAFADEFQQPLQAKFVQLEQLPQTPSGDIDVSALRKTFAAATQQKADKVAPRDEIEETLTRIATEVFGASEPIGIKDNFFDVGANSLLIVKMHHEVQLQLGVEFPMVELFNSTTVEKLALFLGEQGSKTSSATADAARSAGQDRRAAMQKRQQGRARKRT